MVTFSPRKQILEQPEGISSTNVVSCGAKYTHTCTHKPLYPSPHKIEYSWIQFSSVAQSCPTVCDPMDCSRPGLPVHHQLPEFTQTHVHRVDDSIQPSHPLSSPSPPALNLSQHQGLFKWVSSSHQVPEVLEFQLQHQSYQWIFRTDFIKDGLVGSPCSPLVGISGGRGKRHRHENC